MCDPHGLYWFIVLKLHSNAAKIMSDGELWNVFSSSCNCEIYASIICIQKNAVSLDIEVLALRKWKTVKRMVLSQLSLLDTCMRALCSPLVIDVN